MKKRVLCIALGKFDYFPSASLDGPAKDLAHLTELFKKDIPIDTFEWVPAELADDEFCKDVLLAFKKGKKAWPRNTRNLICFSSHGSHVPSALEEDGYDEVTVCKNFNGLTGGILDEWWFNYFQGIPSTSQSYLLADTCMSTGLTRSLHNKSKYLVNPYCLVDGPLKKKGLLTAAFSSNNVDANDLYPGVLIPGCEENGTSADTPTGGALTNAFISIMKKLKPLTNRELIAGIREYLLANRFSQKPVLQCAPRFVDDKFF